VRGVAEDGSDLVISRDYINRGLRSRAEELVSIELGPKPEREVRTATEREVDAERWTRLDIAIRMAAEETGFIDLQPDHPGADDPEVRRLAIGRLQRLEHMGLATAVGQVSGWSGSTPCSSCATSACAATSSRPCTAPSPSGVRIEGSAIM